MIMISINDEDDDDVRPIDSLRWIRIGTFPVAEDHDSWMPSSSCSSWWEFRSCSFVDGNVHGGLVLPFDGLRHCWNWKLRFDRLLHRHANTRPRRQTPNNSNDPQHRPRPNERERSKPRLPSLSWSLVRLLSKTLLSSCWWGWGWWWSGRGGKRDVYFVSLLLFFYERRPRGSSSSETAEQFVVSFSAVGPSHRKHCTELDIFCDRRGRKKTSWHAVLQRI